MSISYKDQLRNPKWQKKRLEIMQRDTFMCQICADTEETLNVHHKRYVKGKKAWEYNNEDLITICETCHRELTAYLKLNGDYDSFSLIKLEDFYDCNRVLVVYTGGIVTFKMGDNEITLPDSDCKHLVQFLINNWLKNGEAI